MTFARAPTPKAPRKGWRLANPSILLLLLLGCATSVQSVSERQPSVDREQLPRFRLRSKADVTLAIGRYDMWGDAAENQWLQAMVVATEGRRVIPWLKEIASDTTLPLDKRLAAILTLGMTRDPEVVPTLLSLATEGDWLDEVVSVALLGFTDPLACERHQERARSAYWLGRVRGANAVIGLGYCDPAVALPLIQQIRADSRDSFIREIADSAAMRLRRPMPERLTPPWAAGPPEPDGRLVPSSKFAAMIRDRVCRPQCPVGPLPPDFFQRRRERDGGWL